MQGKICLQVWVQIRLISRASGQNYNVAVGCFQKLCYYLIIDIMSLIWGQWAETSGRNNIDIHIYSSRLIYSLTF